MNDRVMAKCLAYIAYRRIDATEFARLIDVSPQVFNNWKRRVIPAKHHKKIAAVLKVTLDELLSDEPAGKPPRLASDWPFSFPPSAVDKLNDSTRKVYDQMIKSIEELVKSAGVCPVNLKPILKSRGR